MSSNSINIKDKDKLALYCPYCGASGKDIAVWDEMVKCHKCYRFSAAFGLDDYQQE